MIFHHYLLLHCIMNADQKQMQSEIFSVQFSVNKEYNYQIEHLLITYPSFHQIGATVPARCFLWEYAKAMSESSRREGPPKRRATTVRPFLSGHSTRFWVMAEYHTIMIACLGLEYSHDIHCK